MIETNPRATDIGRQMAALSPAQRALLELRLMKKNRREQTTRHVIARQLKSAPLSYNQQGLWVLNQLMPGESVYHTPTAARLTGELDVEALKKALQAIVDRHDALRTTFVVVDGEPMQTIASKLSLEMPLVDLGSLAETVREEEAQRLLQDEVGKPFDLSQDPLIRGLLLRLRDEEHILLITMDHTVTDGWSIGLFHKELSALYQAFV